MSRIDQITRHLEQNMTHQRFLHTLGVCAFGTELALRHGVDTEQVLLAALLHDCAKGYTEEQNRALRPMADRYLEPVDQDFPALLHGPIGAVVAENSFDVKDPVVLEAIAFHSTGNGTASPVLQVIIAADYCEPTRDFPGVDEARRLVREVLKNGVFHILNGKVKHLEQKNRKPHPRVFDTIASLEQES